MQQDEAAAEAARREKRLRARGDIRHPSAECVIDMQQRSEDNCYSPTSPAYSPASPVYGDDDAQRLEGVDDWYSAASPAYSPAYPVHAAAHAARIVLLGCDV